MIDDADDDMSSLDDGSIGSNDHGSSQVASALALNQDLNEDEMKEYYDSHAMIVDGFRCPDQFIDALTPMEFEEMVTLFKTYDVNGNGTIDKHEARKILFSLGMDSSLERADELIKLVDADGSGEIDFPEYCRFIILVKNGDERFASFSGMVDKIKETPLGELEHQLVMRNLRSHFVTIEVREATAFSPQIFVVELRISGLWYSQVNGKTVSVDETKRFQGIAQNARDAKYNAAKAALLKLGAMMPGVNFNEGEFNDEWYGWIDQNLARGVDPVKIVSILKAKGFHPYKNIELMQRITVWQLYEQFTQVHPNFDLTGSLAVDPHFQLWIKDTVNKGFDGEVIFKVLKDRGLTLSEEHLWYTQRLRNNELGPLIEVDGRAPKFLDFWQACMDGGIEDVILYLEAGMSPNEEKIHRTSSISLKPLMLAAAGGHSNVISALIKYNADIHAIDKRGRNALHHAAINGHVDAALTLLDAGVGIFDGDFQGNNPLHLAAENNHVKMVDFLAYKGQNFTREITSDKLRVKVNTKFDDLAAIVFEAMQDKKLSRRDYRRFEKTWCHEAAEMFRSMMDKNVRHMLAPSCEEIAFDTLVRFDPRPETTAPIMNPITGRQIMIPIVPGPTELGIILRYIFRQAALDGVNRFKRTPFHVACDLNKLSSHEECINLLMNKHGCNLLMRDIHGRRPIELLIMDKAYSSKPSSTQAREEIINEERDARLEKVSSAFAKEEAEYALRRRQSILDDCIKRASELTFILWECTREACVYKDTFAGYEMYEDPDTLNYMYTKKPLNPLEGDKYEAYSWDIPPVIRSPRERRIALNYLIGFRSKRTRSFGEKWEMYRCTVTSYDFFYNKETKDLVLYTPPELSFPVLQKSSVAVKKLGFGNEWELCKDQYGNDYYRHRISKDCFWDQPIDACEVEAKDKFCTAHQFGHQAREQRWYSCEQCNRSWKNAGEASKAVLRICEPCIFRCHDGHRGIRFCMSSSVVCGCAAVCRITQSKCNGCELSAKQISIQRAAYDNRTEIIRRREQVALMPLVFAPVPPTWPNGAKKHQSGWLLSRRPPPNGLLNFGNLLGNVRKGDDDATVTTASTADKSAASVTDEELASVTAKSAGSLLPGEHLNAASVSHLLSVPEIPYTPPAGLPPGWIEAIDVEETEDIEVGTRILVVCFFGPPKCYGNIISKVRQGFFKVRYDHTSDEEVVERSRIEIISKPVFYCNLKTGQSAWTIQDACNNPFEAGPLNLPGPEWSKLLSNSLSRRYFGQYEEYVYHYPQEMQLLEYVYYVDYDMNKQDQAALLLQRLYRQKFRRRKPFAMWVTKAFTATAPDSCVYAMKEKAGWAYIRRRSNYVGDFRDKEGNDWEEYLDKVSCEYFYFMEEWNEYNWLKPPLPTFKLALNGGDNIQYYNVGDEFQYVFEGRREPDPVVVTKLRFDDETGEDKYDIVHKWSTELKKIWVPRALLKAKPLDGDMLKLMRDEIKWRGIIKRQLEKVERLKQRDKLMKIQAEKEILASLKDGKRERDLKLSVSIEPTVFKLIQARMKRITQEAQDYAEEVDRAEGVARREKVRELVEKAKAETTKKFSRAEILSMTRSFDMRLRMEEKVLLRDKVQNEMIARKNATIKRNNDAEEGLRYHEMVMTTPRSLERRRIIRKLAMGMRRQEDMYIICEWGCMEWVKVGFEQIDHQLRRCPKRILACTLGCPMKLSEEDWLKQKFTKTKEELLEEALTTTLETKTDTNDGVTVQQYHETEECPKRVVSCPRNCMEWVCFEILDKHMNELCTKRPAKPIYCRLGCNCSFGGLVEKLIEAEDERLMHETEECEYRIVRCNWQYDDGRMCAAQMPANERNNHREYHLLLLGITLHKVPGTYMFTVPKKTFKVKIQLWGGGGGSGYFLNRQGGSGGGGAFVEAMVSVQPYDILEIVVASGGGGGAAGTEVEVADIELMRQGVTDTEVISGSCGQSLGGTPGGGEGYGGGKYWACGGGGGYSCVSKRSPKGNVALLVAAGGGGGGSVDGMPGGGLDGVLPGTHLDSRNGGTATVHLPGSAGDSGSVYNSAWQATDGTQWQGGNGCEFGAGGGGGYFGGGGGGNSPGIGGGGGGGSSYVYVNSCTDYVVIAGHGIEPGGLQHNPPEAVGLGEWDKVGGWCGQGAIGQKDRTSVGNNGAVRIILPGSY